MFLFDRIYGELRFPDTIRKVLDCPGLLRLREVRMANIPFFSFPSFAAVTRYEHSLGVCHLAKIFAENAGLCEKDRIEIMLAALYHDVATPPFGHAVEEVLDQLFGFDHESKLRMMITGEGDSLGGERTQIFAGRSLKLRSLCQSKQGRNMGLDAFRIADLATGVAQGPLGNLICSKGMDLDNIDNVIRSGTAMGIDDCDPRMAETLAGALRLVGDRIVIDEAVSHEIDEWRFVRKTLYGMIFASLEDFALQTMLKDAVHRLADTGPEHGFRDTDWFLTDSELIHERLLRHLPTANIVKRMRLREIYNCLAFLCFEGHHLKECVLSNLKRIEQAASHVYKDFIRRTLNPLEKELKAPDIIANYYIDKRVRPIERSFVFFDRQRTFEESSNVPRVLLGIFTPHHRKWDTHSSEMFVADMEAHYASEGIAVRDVKTTKGKYPSIE